MAGSYLSMVELAGVVKDVLYSKLLRLAHDSPLQIAWVELSGKRTAVAVLHDGSRLRARYTRSESVTDLQSMLSPAGVQLIRQ